MTTPSLIIMQLPSSLWNSPLYVAYDYYVGDPLDTLQGDLEDMFYLTDVLATTNYMLNLKFLLKVSPRKIPGLDILHGFNRLRNAIAYADDSLEATMWLLRLTTNIHQLRSPFSKTGLQLKTNILHDNKGAIIGPLSEPPAPWTRAFTGR